MDTVQQFTMILLAFLLVMLNGYFVASEFSIVKVRETRILELVQKGHRRAATAHLLLRKMDEYLSATQLGITMASLALGWIGEPAFARLIEPAFKGLGGLQPLLAHSVAMTLAFLIITLLHIVLGELAPKSLAIQRAESVVLWISTPMAWFYKISWPFIWILNGTANLVLRTLKLPSVSEGERAHSEEELRLILTQSHGKGVLGADARRMLERVFEFADRSVRQVMVPSMDVVFLDVRRSLKQNLETARRQRHTRYPLCEGSLDRVLGVVHIKDLFWKHEQLGPHFDLSRARRPVQFVPDSARLQNLLTRFRSTRSHLAVVVDEYGSTVGIVTLEDVLEELVGEIEDEFDTEASPPKIQKLDDRRCVVHGRVLLEELDYELGITIDDQENDTIGGHVMMLLGRAARAGDEVVVADAYRVRVSGMKGLQITSLLFERIGSEQSPMAPREPITPGSSAPEDDNGGRQ